jgi:putative transposase
MERGPLWPRDGTKRALSIAMLPRRPRRLPADDYRGPNRYFLTFCTIQRRTWFTQPDVVELVLGEFRYTAEREGFAIPAHCFMPDHVHLLVEATDPAADLRRLVKLMKQRSGYRFRRDRRESHWQPSYFDRTLRSDEATSDVMRYIFENPVRAGLVRSPLDYPHLGSDLGPLEEILVDLSY